MTGMLKKAIASLVWALTATGASAVAAYAEPATYNFSGTLYQTGQSGNPDWAFAAGQTFRGQLVYDPAAVQNSYDYINQPDFQLTFHTSPLVSLSYSIDTPNGTFSYSPPAEFAYAAVGVSDGAGLWWTGVDMRWSNYPISGAPGNDVPTSGYVGSWYAHSSFVSLLDTRAIPLTSTDVDVDLVALFDALPAFSRQFSVRFSDPANWSGFDEHIDGAIHGEITSFALAAAVPEPGTWAMMLVGFAMVGAATRSRRRATEVTYA